MGEREEFLGWARSRRRNAEEALHNGDAAPRLAIWARNDPVTVLGAWKSANGQEQLRELFRQLAASFSDCVSYSYDIVAADVVGDMAYLSGHGPLKSDGTLIVGRVGDDVDQQGVDQQGGYDAARQTGLALLATLRAHLGSLDRVVRLVKLLGRVNSTADLENHPAGINGLKQLFS